MGTDALIARIAQHQNGLVTRTQAQAAGLTPRMIQVRISSGRWVVRRRGVYAIGGVPETERQVILAASLACGGVASHLTAAKLWGLDLPQPTAIELIGSSTRLAGVRAHRSSTLERTDLASIGAIRVTGPARTLVDCSDAVPASELGAVVDDALRRGLVRLEQLRACHERIDTGPGRRPTVAMREVLAARTPGYGAGDSGREADIVRLLAAAGFPAPVLGHRVKVGGRTYKLDISWPESMAGIEFDGWATHKTFTAFHGDRNRLRRLVAKGWRILLVTAQTDLHELIGDVGTLLSARSATA